MAETGWWALLGPPPHLEPGGRGAGAGRRGRALAGPAVVGPLRVRPGGSRLVEHVRDEPFDLAAVIEFETYPVVVEGSWLDARHDAPRPDQAGAAERGAARQLHRLGCLLSLAWDEAWRARTAPRDAGREQPHVPPSWPAPPQELPRRPAGAGAAPSPAPRPEVARRSRGTPVAPGARHVEVPPWADASWAALAADPVVDIGLSFWHQGLLLLPEFPSFALVAFTASVEALSGCRAFRSALRGVHAEPCPVCGNRAKAARRFWATVALVADEEELRRLQWVVDVYDSRSDVAHGARMFGFETAWGPLYEHGHHRLERAAGQVAGRAMGGSGAGAASPSAAGVAGAPGAPDGPAGEGPEPFLWETLPAVRQVAARLLRRALGLPGGAGG